ncbi:hypothetical protein XA68_10502 [Ophiocordyceps unilateralis]|uniref:Nucleotide-diphospho-sugar transferase domain-containing protein n=1 Tax=Ophiocordyceps unilateralis TaxID=268505 RepID=A0A2A9PII9_OPHUN|nr:hypothetical protein XA68_10502 [Ophiocordyceps unilateralis]
MARLLLSLTWIQLRITKAIVVLIIMALVAWKGSMRPTRHLNTVQTGHASSQAYVFYATQDMYTCSVLVNIHVLQNVLHTRHRIAVLVSGDISADMRQRLEAANATVIEETPPPLHNDTSVPCWLEQILVLDSDQLIMRDLDDTFNTTDADFAAPGAYWLDNKTISSTCMLIRPSNALWASVQQAMASIGNDVFDMDLVNDLFRDQNHRLHGSYATLNSHWEDWNVPGWFNPVSTEKPKEQRASAGDLDALMAEAKIVQFTAVGKPWTYTVDNMQEKRPDAHPLLAQMWRQWRTIAFETCPTRLFV